MNPSDWIYHLNLGAALKENGFLDPCARADRRAPRRRTTAAGPRLPWRLALLAPLLRLAASVLQG